MKNRESTIEKLEPNPRRVFNPRIGCLDGLHLTLLFSKTAYPNVEKSTRTTLGALPRWLWRSPRSQFLSSAGKGDKQSFFSHFLSSVQAKKEEGDTREYQLKREG